MADDGKRSNNPAPTYTGDLSSDPKLVATSIKVPTYSEAAIDAGFEGKVTVDVYVDVKGNVTEAELRNKIGFGMDERIKKAALELKYVPRKNKLGVAEAGWTEVKFTLQLP